MSEFFGGLFFVSIFTDFVASIIYLVMAVRRARRPQIRAGEFDVRFEAVWGMVLAAPVLWLVLGIATAPQNDWRISLLLIPVVALYAVPIAALAGWRLPRAVRVYPAVIAIAPIVLMCLSGLGAVFWNRQSQDFTFVELVLGMLIPTRLGVGFAADCTVAVRFARAVDRRQNAVVSDPLPVAHVDAETLPREPREPRELTVERWAEWAHHE